LAVTQKHKVGVIRDVIFGHAPNADGVRSLKMDVYRPRVPFSEKLPAVILAFGGAFHRGSRQDDTVIENDQSNTPIAEYCRRLAEQGYVAFSVDYRLAQEKPLSGETPVLGDMEVPLERIRIVRDILGLEPISVEEMREVQEAAIDDMVCAYRFVAGAARRFGVAADKIFVGGFSAGGRNAITAAFGEDIDPAGVVCMSSYVPSFIVSKYLQDDMPVFPVLAISAENDLGYIQKALPEQHVVLTEGGIDSTWRVVPGYGHFYPADAQSHDGTTGMAASSVFEEICAFLNRSVGNRQRNSNIEGLAQEVSNEQVLQKAN
jgi:dienelactone hydrolase